MKKLRIVPLLLVAALLLGVSAQAAENSTENFVRTKTYSGEFSDLTEDNTFYDNVSALYEYGLSLGKTDGTYGLQDPLTVSQVLIFAGRIRCLYETGAPEPTVLPLLTEGQPHHSFLAYLKDRGVVGDELDQRLYETATRAEVAHVLARLLPEEALPPVHAELIDEGYAAGLILPDVDAFTPYRDDILTLYRTGISRGVDNAGSYCPAEPISRGAVAAMLTRMVDPALRVQLNWNSAAGKTLAGLVPDAVPVAAPMTDQEIDDCVRHMLATDSNVMTLRFPQLTESDASGIMTRILAQVKSYCEQCYNSVTCVYSKSGDMELTFSAAGLPAPTLRQYRKDTMAAAISVHDAMWAQGLLSADMTDTEKARAYFDWMVNSCIYDHSSADDPLSLSHIAYSLFCRGTAVCDGYTGAYNLLLKLEGIPCHALANSAHIWTVAELDGTEVHIDTTWGDQEGYVADEFFAMTPEESFALHPW